MSYQPDPILFSKRTWTSVTGVLMLGASLFGINLDALIQEQIINSFVIIGSLVTTVLPIWSKVNEQIKIKKGR